MFTCFLPYAENQQHFCTPLFGRFAGGFYNLVWIKKIHAKNGKNKMQEYEKY